MDPIAQQLIATWGLPGAIIVFLVYVIGLREKEVRDERIAYKATVKDYEKRIDDLHDSGILQLTNTLTVIAENRENLTAFKNGQEVFLTEVRTLLKNVGRGD